MKSKTNQQKPSLQHITDHEFLGLCMEVLNPPQASIASEHIHGCLACSKRFEAYRKKYREVEAEEQANPANFAFTERDKQAFQAVKERLGKIKLHKQ